MDIYYFNSWLISGPLGQALCKLVPFSTDVSAIVSIQSLVLKAVLKLWYFPSLLQSSIQSYALSLFSPLGSSRWLSSVPISLHLQTWWISRRVGVCAALERSLWRILILWQWRRFNFDYILANPVGVDSHTLHYHLYKAQVTEDSWRVIGQRWTTTPTKGTKSVKDDHCYCVRTCYPTPSSGFSRS